MKPALHFLWICLISFQVLASDGSISEDKVEQYIELSGIEDLIDSVPAQIDAMINQKLLTSENPETEKEVMQIITDSWDGYEIKSAISSHIKSHSNDSDISKLIEWRKSPLVVKITAAELESSDPYFQNNLLRYIADLQVSPPKPETIQAIRRLVESTDMVDMMVEMTVQITKAMMVAFLPTQSEIGADLDLNKQFDSMRVMLEAQMEQQMILMSYYIYRNISDDELNRYASFYETSLGKKELEIVNQSLGFAMTMWAEKSAVAIAKNMERND